MSFIQKHSKDLKKPTPFENTKRLILEGAVQEGWMHAEVEIKFEYIDPDSVRLKVKFYSLYDHSLVKEIDVKIPAYEGDTLKLPGTIVSYKINLFDLEG
jgi:hypothetical protein